MAPSQAVGSTTDGTQSNPREAGASMISQGKTLGFWEEDEIFLHPSEKRLFFLPILDIQILGWISGNLKKCF
jgi:hypothetical protein